MKRPGKLLLLSATVLLFLTACILYIFKSPALDKPEDAYIYVYKGEGTEDLIHKLQQSYGLKFPSVFRILATRMKLENGLKNGRYSVPSGTDIIKLIRIFREGKTKTANLVIRPLGNMEKLAGRCGDKLEPDSIDYIKVFKDSALLASIGFTPATVYALPIPDTYNVLWHTDADELLLFLKKAYENFWNPERTVLLLKCGMSKIEVSILASIVAKETNKNDEMPLVAGMYINRLRTGMPLQADPTVKFALNMPGLQRLYTRHLTVESPYNTYKYKGLPPGPICIPPVQAIDAVLHYSEHNFLYMCAREDFSGYHNFAKDYKTHLKNAARYRAALDSKGIH